MAPEQPEACTGHHGLSELGKRFPASHPERTLHLALCKLPSPLSRTYCTISKQAARGVLPAMEASRRTASSEDLQELSPRKRGAEISSRSLELGSTQSASACTLCFHRGSEDQRLHEKVWEGTQHAFEDVCLAVVRFGCVQCVPRNVSSVPNTFVTRPMPGYAEGCTKP